MIEVPEGMDSGEEREERGFPVNSGQFTGMSVEQGRREITRYAEREGFSGHMTQYKLRDWRHWGAPIPVLYCDKCGVSCSVKLTHTHAHTHMHTHTSQIFKIERFCW